MTELSSDTGAWVTHPWVTEGQGRVRFGIAYGPLADWSTIRDFVQAVEGLGFDSYWYCDHPIIGPDCWTLLAGLSQCTSRLRFGPLVSCVYYRNPVILARMAADVNQMSGGRLVLGLGVGDFAFEFEQLGIACPSTRERQQALEDTLHIVNGLHGASGPVTHDGAHVRASNAALVGLKTPQPRIPILLGGGGERVTLRQVAQYADVSNLSESVHAGTARTTDDVARKYGVLRGHCEAIGRPYDSILRTQMTLFLLLAESRAAADAKLAQVDPLLTSLLGDSIVAMTPDEAITYYRGLVAAGVQYFIPAVNGLDEETLTLLAREVIPAVQPG